MSKLTKIGLAKKVLDEARKPENQAKVKQMVGKAKAKKSSRQRPRG
jgi:hypothetical protein